MTLTTAPIRLAADAVCAREGVDLKQLSREELLALSGQLAGLRRAADLAFAQVAAEVDCLSRPEDGSAGLAARQGFRSAGELIARATGGTVAEAQRLISAGSLLADADADTGLGGEGSGSTAVDGCADVVSERAATPLSPVAEVRAELARAARAQEISVEVVSIAERALAGLPDEDRTRELFLKAIAKAPGLALHQVRALFWRAQAAADPEAWKARESRQQDDRFAVLRDDADGMVTLTARLAPLDAAPVRAVLDANVRWAMQQRREDPGSDVRSPGQMRADILVGLCRHALDCDQPTSGVKTTVVVRMTQADLEADCGVGEVDGLAQPVSVSALREGAADAEVIPVVLGGQSEVLDWGRSRRLFTPAQRLALVERDGGCSWCHAPPSWCEAHHIRWWERDRGPTDLANGVLLCARCHHRIHGDGWGIDVRDGVVWFIPPRSIDPAQTPRLGGRARYEIAA
ncbi:HNH endonuclease [Demequina sp. TTPB684]|uniref:HNH endonuclease n=1 Tax=unclassified Demequina TaxID=2620311 RepID=UPI001CF2EC30|nr:MULTISPECIES: HNH endonuclease signature motif containing protein [unclassified Demequina]MCB2412787.1 HNH endonuclease [Demequina sp. TTPB684]UPU87134.1 HNH endonuclease [Demequina sp. TMPB413]